MKQRVKSILMVALILTTSGCQLVSGPPPTANNIPADNPGTPSIATIFEKTPPFRIENDGPSVRELWQEDTMLTNLAENPLFGLEFFDEINVIVQREDIDHVYLYLQGKSACNGCQQILKKYVFINKEEQSITIKELDIDEVEEANSLFDKGVGQFLVSPTNDQIAFVGSITDTSHPRFNSQSVYVYDLAQEKMIKIADIPQELTLTTTVDGTTTIIEGAMTTDPVTSELLINPQPRS